MIDTKVFFAEPPIVSRDDTSYLLRWKVPSNLPYFDGHFPDMPILPAVAIIDASVCFLGEAIKHPAIVLNEVRSCKITGVVTPGLELRIFITTDKQLARMLWRRNDDDVTVCDVNFSYR